MTSSRTISGSEARIGFSSVLTSFRKADSSTSYSVDAVYRGFGLRRYKKTMTPELVSDCGGNTKYEYAKCFGTEAEAASPDMGSSIRWSRQCHLRRQATRYRQGTRRRGDSRLPGKICIMLSGEWDNLRDKEEQI